VEPVVEDEGPFEIAFVGAVVVFYVYVVFGLVEWEVSFYEAGVGFGVLELGWHCFSVMVIM